VSGARGWPPTSRSGPTSSPSTAPALSSDPTPAGRYPSLVPAPPCLPVLDPAAAEVELPVDSWTGDLVHGAFGFLGIATTALLLGSVVPTGRPSTAAVACGLATVLAGVLHGRLRTTWILVPGDRRLDFTRRALGLELRRPVLGFEQVAAVTVRGVHRWARPGYGGGGWTYQVVALTLGGDLLELSPEVPEAVDEANRLAEGLATLFGAAFEAGRAHHVLRREVDPADGSALLRQVPGS